MMWGVASQTDTMTGPWGSLFLSTREGCKMPSKEISFDPCLCLIRRNVWILKNAFCQKILQMSVSQIGNMDHRSPMLPFLFIFFTRLDVAWWWFGIVTLGDSPSAAVSVAVSTWVEKADKVSKKKTQHTQTAVKLDHRFIDQANASSELIYD